jgi:peptidoglycan hydrolase CwlO-like protein
LAKKVVEKVPSWISRILLPEIRTIVKEEVSNQLKPIEAKISALDEKIDERTKSLEAKILALDSKIEEKTKALDSKIEERTKALEKEIIALRNEMNARFDSIEKRLPLIERLVLLEARMEKLEKHVGIH